MQAIRDNRTGMIFQDSFESLNPRLRIGQASPNRLLPMGWQAPRRQRIASRAAQGATHLQRGDREPFRATNYRASAAAI